MKLSHPACPQCGYRFDSEAGYDLVTLNGTKRDVNQCPKCGVGFWMTEVVDRYYLVEVTK